MIEVEWMDAEMAGGIPTLPHGVLEALSLGGGGSDDAEDEGTRRTPGDLVALRGLVVRTQFYSSKLFFFDVQAGQEGGEEGSRAGGGDDDAAQDHRGGGEGVGDHDDGAGENGERGVFAFLYRAAAKHSQGSGHGGVLTIADVVRLSREMDIGDLVELRYMVPGEDDVRTTPLPMPPVARMIMLSVRTVQGGTGRSFEVWDLKVVNKGEGGSAEAPEERPRMPIYAGGKPRAQPDDKSLLTATVYNTRSACDLSLSRSFSLPGRAKRSSLSS